MLLESHIGYNMRLLSSVLVSHQVWSEACNVEMNIALCVPEADIGKRKSSMDSNPTMLDLCAPVRVSIAPKPIKKTLWMMVMFRNGAQEVTKLFYNLRPTYKRASGSADLTMRIVAD